MIFVLKMLFTFVYNRKNENHWHWSLLIIRYALLITQLLITRNTNTLEILKCLNGVTGRIYKLWPYLALNFNIVFKFHHWEFHVMMFLSNHACDFSVLTNLVPKYFVTHSDELAVTPSDKLPGQVHILKLFEMFRLKPS